MEVIRVIAAVIRNASRILVCRRPSHKRHGGRWEFPGGKIATGESLRDAARRELAEELGVAVGAVGEPCFTAIDPNSPFAIQFVEVEITGAPQALEHSEIRWCTLEEMRQLSFAPADESFFRDYLLAHAIKFR